MKLTPDEISNLIVAGAIFVLLVAALILAQREKRKEREALADAMLKAYDKGELDKMIDGLEREMLAKRPGSWPL